MPKRDRDQTPDDVVNGALDVLSKDLPDTADPDDDALDGDLVDDDQPGTGRAVPQELVFTTSSSDDGDEDQPEVEVEVEELKLDGVTLYAAKPTGGAWTLVLSTVSRAATQADKAHALLNFVFSAFDEASQMWIQNRLYDPSDKFDVDTLADIVNALIERWAPEQTRQQRRDALIKARRNGGGAGPRRSGGRRR